MKKLTLLVAILMLVHLYPLAEEISFLQAKKVALNFYFERYNQFEGQVLYDQLSIRSIHVESNGIQNFYYVFQVNNIGFIIVSAEDRLSPVMGYSFKQAFVGENQPPNVQYWFRQYVEQVNYVREIQLKPEKRITDKWAFYLNENFGSIKIATNNKEIEPLLTTNWDQGFPENYFCPETSTGGSVGRTWAGCTATAAAQIGYYWRWPDHGQGYTSYIPASFPEYGVQYANFGNTWYRFDEMVDSLSIVNTAIAEYIYHIAVGMHTDFRPDGSPITTTDSIHYFFKFFPIEFLFRNNMPDEQWKEILTGMLDDGYPILYSGFVQTLDVGHAFVCDGYQDEDYFHFNLGWGGQSNGYYTIDNIQGFNFGQYIVESFCPDTIGFSYPQYCAGMDTCLNIEGSIADGSGPVKDYLNNTQASWLIDPQTEMDSVINIEIMVKRLDLFNDGDRLYIYDGEDNTAPLLAEFSGNIIPDVIESTGNKVFVEFSTDNENTASGFYLNYETNRPDWCSSMTQLADPTALIEDGSGDFYYNNLSNCAWIIDPGITEPLTLFFNYFDTEENNDVLQIYDGVSSELIVEISGYYEDPPNPVTSPSGKMMLVFLSNHSVRAQGWEAWYDINTGLQENTLDFDFLIIPNPVTSDIKISFNLQSEEHVTFQVFDVVGQKLECMVNQTYTYGQHSISHNFGHLPNGIYFCCLQAGEEVVIKKIVKL